MTDAPDWEGFGRDLMQDWPTGDIEGSELFEAALRNGLVREIPGGYDPEQHIDAEGICPETGDPWYEYAFSHTRADLATPLNDPRVKALVEAANGVVNEYYNQVHGPVIYNIKHLDAALEAIASPSISALEENK